MKQLIIITLMLCGLLSATAAHATQRNLKVVAGSAQAQKRVALVIGNAKYQGAPALRNPVNDAKAITDALNGLGFEVIEVTDATQKEMNRAITAFGSKLNSETVALFFYAGHGLQVRGKNYIIPVDAQIEAEAAVATEAVSIDAVLEQLNASPISIVILDACRNNPFERSFRKMGGGGLAQMDAPKGSFIAYATAPGKTANDGDGTHGLFTQELLKQIDIPGLGLEEVFKRVRANVSKDTGDKQIPWDSSSLTGDFYFVQPSSGHMEGNAVTEYSFGKTLDPALVELEMWQSVKDSTSVEDFSEYLRNYPGGKFSGLAHARINRLSQPVPTESQQTQLLESDMVGRWEFGRLTGALFISAGKLCDLELLSEKGEYGNVIRNCNSNESFWRLNGNSLEFLGRSGQITTIFTRKGRDHWEGAYLGTGSSLFSGIIHYLKK